MRGLSWPLHSSGRAAGTAARGVQPVCVSPLLLTEVVSGECSRESRCSPQQHIIWSCIAWWNGDGHAGDASGVWRMANEICGWRRGESSRRRSAPHHSSTITATAPWRQQQQTQRQRPAQPQLPLHQRRHRRHSRCPVRRRRRRCCSDWPICPTAPICTRRARVAQASPSCCGYGIRRIRHTRHSNRRRPK